VGRFDLDDVLKGFGEPILPDGDDDGERNGRGAVSPTYRPAEPMPAAAHPAPPAPPAHPSPPPPTTVPAVAGTSSAVGGEDYYAPGPEPASGGDEASESLTAILLRQGVVTGEQIATGERVAKQTPGKPMSQILIELGVDEVGVQEAVARLARLPFERIDANSPKALEHKAFTRLGAEFCKAQLVLPLRREGARLVVGTTSPDDVFLLDDVKRRLGVASVKHVLVTARDIYNLIEGLDEAKTDEYDVDQILADVDVDDVEVEKDVANESDLEDAESSPVVRYVNHIIQTAVKEGASDIHIEPEDKALKVRFRIDGVLFEMMNPPKKMHAALTSRIKIMANLDIAERRLPQDGRIRAGVLGRRLDLRVSTVPTAKGEKTVMRILDTRSINVTLDELGFAEDTLTIWKNQIAQPHGILLVTGPTGSGKTTTLYSSIKQMDLRKLNVSTVEDPVEYNLAGITQIQTHDRIGMTFAKALKALLRQDPDVIMLGEIRDMETATTAIQAALTGHLVLSTLHTNDAPSSITRLINIGIEPFLVGAAVNAVLAQRLVRRICGTCKEERPVSEDVVDFLTMHGVQRPTLTYGKGCNKCRETGYSGRTGLYELLVLDDHMRDAIARNPNVTEFRRTCCERGMVTLREDGFRKVGNGMTTVEEVMRVTEATI
jgi:type IV pilus assembly protein PilB